MSFLRGELIGSGLEPGGGLERLDLLLVGQLRQILALDLVDDVTWYTESCNGRNLRVRLPDIATRILQSKLNYQFRTESLMGQLFIVL